MPPVSAPRKNRPATLLERRYAIALREDMGLSYPEISQVTGFNTGSIWAWVNPKKYSDANKQRYENNRERISAYGKRRRSEYPDENRIKCKKRYAKNPKKYNQSSRKWREENLSRSKINILRRASKEKGYAEPSFSPEDLDAYLGKHDGLCDICKTGPKPGGRRLCTEHCHVTGALRGIVCNGCNVVLGCLERPDLEKFRAYLTKPPIAGGN